MPVEITGGWVRAEKGIGGGIVLGWFAPGPFGGTQGRQDERKRLGLELWWVPPSEVGLRWLPRSLRCVADSPNCGAEEKIGLLRSG